MTHKIRKRSKTGPSAVKVAQRRLQVLKLRETGLTIREIAAHLDMSRSQTHHDLQHALGELAAEICTEAEKLRALEEERLQTMTRCSMKGALAGDPRAIANLIRISESRRRLWGIDAPDKMEVRGGGLTPEAVQTIRQSILGIEPTE